MSIDNASIVRDFDAGIEGVARGGTDVVPIFSRVAVQNMDRSTTQGRPVFDTVEMVTIIIPGDPGNSPVRRVKESDKTRFAHYYERFKREEEMVFDGTILEAWPILNTAQVAGYKAQGFFTVEHIANCPDAKLGTLGMGSMMLRDKAKAFVEASAQGGVPERLVQEAAQAKAQMGLMQETINELRNTVERLAREHHIPSADVERQVSVAMSHVSDPVAGKKALPDGWDKMNAKDSIDLVDAFKIDAAIKPRNRAEAQSLLAEYAGTIAAFKK